MTAVGGTMLCIFAGLLWSVVGWAYNRAARHKEHPAGIIFAITLCGLGLVVSVALATGVRMHGSAWRVGPAGWWMVCSGVANVAGGICAQVAMSRGKAGAVWAIVQSAPLVPLLLAVGVHEERPPALSWAGIGVMSAAVALMAACSSRAKPPERLWQGRVSRWGGTPWALMAMGAIGLQQAAMSQPSHLGLTPAPLLRLMIFFATMACCAGLVCAAARVRIGRATWAVAAFTALAGLSGQYLIVRALDLLAEVRRAGLAYPCAVGSTIVSFAMWRRARGERLPWPAWLAMALIVAGLLAIGLGD